MVDVTRMPENGFGYVPTPALVAPIEFTLKLEDYAALGGHMDHVQPLSSLGENNREQRDSRSENPVPVKSVPIKSGPREANSPQSAKR
jgi:hypothetical protein